MQRNAFVEAQHKWRDEVGHRGMYASREAQWEVGAER
jgi:hypothetical protein